MKKITKEFIEKEGWTYNPEFNEYYKGMYAIIFYENWMIINQSEEDEHGFTAYTIFKGECNSIKDFRYICKLLKI